ncbi:hypothetical protein [Paenibacillus pinisoli]|uniref:hypothetical protein n=1 Tax=Paenibacillus pinisoli TaxID=1276110 RepID=UPI001403463F|nr:hypothetical protein [Paenibacillus pinisoli]
MIIEIVENTNGRFTIYVTTKEGNRYWCDYADKPTEDMVRRQWEEDRKWFVQIN